MAVKQGRACAAITEAAGRIIETSLCEIPGGWLALVRTERGTKLAAAVSGASPLAGMWAVERAADIGSVHVDVMELNANNAAVVRRCVKWTAPAACTARGVSVGFSDWLGEAGAWAALPFAKRRQQPVLVEYAAADCAELGRNLLQAVDAATWGVLEAGYREGYGAHAASLRSEEDIVKALLYGYSIIGLDCGDKVHAELDRLPDDAVAARYAELQEEFRQALEASYLGAEFQTPGGKVSFTPAGLRRLVLKYGEAIMHAQFIYNSYLKNTPWEINFELSLGEGTLTPQEHYLIANELERNHVKLWAICLNASEDVRLHCGIAAAFGYRLSFADADLGAILPDAVVKYAQGAAHFKLTHTLWLAALQLLAAADAGLLARIAALASLPPVTADELAAGSSLAARYARSYARVLSPQQGNMAPAIKAFVAAHHEEYVSNITKNVENFLKKFS